MSTKYRALKHLRCIQQCCALWRISISLKRPVRALRLEVSSQLLLDKENP